MDDAEHVPDVLTNSSIHDRIHLFVDRLPILTQESVPLDDSCPICLTSFASLFAEESCTSTPESAGIGVTRLVGCGHLFCRKDLAEWIRNFHGSCPTCRHTFLDVRPPSDSDDESSDGGEYLPDEDEEEDGFLDTDGFSEAGEFGIDEMDLDMDDIWVGEEDDEMEELEWGLTDGESESLSDGDISLNEEQAEETGQGALDVGVSVSINEDDDNLDVLDASSDEIVQDEPK